MHKYLNAIGFHDIASEREWYQILLESEKKFSGYDRIALDEHTDLCELRREYGNGIGISSCGFIDENDEEFRRECYFPYFSGSGVSSYADIAVEQKASSPTYIGVCEDVKLGCSIIFHIQNGMEYIKEATRGGLNKSSISITFSGLALSGKILLPVTKDAGAADKRAKDLRNRMMLMSAAKEGNPDAIESLTLDDIDTYAAVSDKIRINPGNIGGTDKIKAVVDAARAKNIPIRVGVNSGSLEKDLIEKYGGVTAEGLVESALDKVKIIEDLGYDNLVISIKSSDVMMCVKAHELIARKTNYPLHVGITESGTLFSGSIKSSIGLGLILGQGIGDTIRVSLTDDPVKEIEAAKLILRTLGLRKGGIEVVSCPTCGRTKIDLIGLASKVEELVRNYDLDIKIAVMGCVVNGPGEAKEADIGIAGGDGCGVLIKHGEIIKKFEEDKLLAVLKDELDNWKD